MRFDREKQRFRLLSTHPGVTLEEVRDQTGFDFDVSADLRETETPPTEDLVLIRGEIAEAIANPYPKFAKSVFGVGEAA